MFAPSGAQAGEFEIDTVIGEYHQGAPVTINDGAKSLVRIRNFETKEAETVANVTIEALKKFKSYAQTITSE